MRIRHILFLILIPVLLFSGLPIYAQENEYEDWDKDDVPEGMEVHKVGDLRVQLPEGSKMRKVGDLLVVESPTEYYARTMSEFKEELEGLKKSQEDIKNELSELKKKVVDMQKKNLVSGKS
ncbi:MAG: hypothetical protein ABH843_05320 [Candidatus Omnitrophota bacterium]